jgi:hypothetical protein
MTDLKQTTTIDPDTAARNLCAELRMMGSPMRGMHLGERQNGTTFWDRDGWPFVERKIAEAFAAMIVSVGAGHRWPVSAAEAECMEKLGFAYLKQHAPELLTPEGLARPIPFPGTSFEIASTGGRVMDRIEKVARAMCRAHGLDPDEEIEIEVHHAPPMKDGAQFAVYYPPTKERRRRWEQSRAAASDAVIAHDAIKEADARP